ncbi:molybdenum cofactor guanylyltransferase [Paenibacillus sp. YSY-4.3]
MEWTGIILAGGKSSRMGSNKAVLPIGGQPVIQRLACELLKAGGEAVISCGSSSAYAELGLPLLQDAYPGCGPLAGLHAGLAASPHKWSLVVGCDMPFANAALFRFMAEQAQKLEEQRSNGHKERIEALISRVGDQAQPLMAMYRCSVLPGLERTLEEGRLRVNQWISGLSAKYISEEELSRISGLPAELAVFNMNRPEDYQTAQLYAKQRNL